MKRVLHLLASNTFSGAENVACTIIKTTDEEAIYASPLGPISDNLEKMGIKYVPLKSFTVKELNKIIDEYKIDIIHAHDYKASFLASFFGRKIRVISHIHCIPEFARKWTILSIAYKLVINKFYKIIMVSNDIKERSIYSKYTEDKIEIIQNVLDPKVIINKSIEFEAEDCDVIFVGRLTDVKNPFYVVDIIKAIKNTNSDIKCFIAGDGDLKEQLIEKIKTENLESNIRLLGFQSNVYPYIKNAKVAILTSKSEGTPMSVIETLILGTPLVSNGVGGLSKMFANHQEYICSNIEEFSNKILEIINSNKEQYKNDCQEIVAEYANIEDYKNKIENIYNS